MADGTPRFDEYDLEVYKAHSLVEYEGAAHAHAMRRVHDGPLPPQRLAGMIRRGLLYRDEEGCYCLTPNGVELAHALRDRLAAASA